MRMAQHDQVASLSDVLRRRTPMHPAPRLPGDARQLPHQRHNGVAGASSGLVDPIAIEQIELSGSRDRRGSILWDDSELGLCFRQRGFNVKPRLPADVTAEQRADAGIRHTCGGGTFIAHRVSPSSHRTAGHAWCGTLHESISNHPRHPEGMASMAQQPRAETILRRRTALRVALGAGAAAAAGLRSAAAQQPAPSNVPSGQVTMEQTEVSLLVNAGWGHGTLTYQGHTYQFRLHNLGVGGIGYSKFSAHGNVFALTKVEDFAGLYGFAQAGAVAATDELHGGVWLQNPAGVRMHLVPSRSGLALNLGADGLVIQFEK